MKGDFRQYWRHRGYWAHLGRKYADPLRRAAYLGAFMAIAAGGFFVARTLQEPERFTVERLVTITTMVEGELVTSVERQVVTLSEPNETQTNLITVVRDGETITIPAKTVLRTDTVTGPTITNTRTETNTRTQTERETTTNTETQTQTDTQTETQTTDRTTTVTEERNVPGPTTTVTTTVTETGPTTTLTETETETQTETETDTVTVTETETVTEPTP